MTSRGTTAAVASLLAWAALVPLVAVAVTKPTGDRSGCFDVCLGPDDWFVFDVLLTPVVILTGGVGLVSARLASRRPPAPLARFARWASTAALAVVVMTWVVLWATD